MSEVIPHNKPNFGREEIIAVQKLLESGFIVQGEKVQLLEQSLSQFIGKKYCSAVSSGTMALSLALKSLGIKSGDEIIIPSYTCSALYHAVKFCNADVVYADIEEETCNLSPDSVRQLLTPKTKAIIYPHMFGQPGYINDIVKFGVPVVEDIAQSIGAKIAGKPVGYFGEVAVASFYATKMLGAGEGGAILTDSISVENYIKDIRDYDESEDLHPRLNAKMTDITAAIALEQLAKLDAFKERRQAIHQIYKNHPDIHLKLPIKNELFAPNYFRQIIIIDDADNFINFMKNSNIHFRKPVYKPLHLYKKQKTLPITEKMWKTQISIPIFVGLKDSDIIAIIKLLSKYEKNR